MPAVHSCRVHLARVSGESCLRRDWVSVTLCTLVESSQFWCVTRGDSQARHETLWLVHHRPLKKWDLNKTRHDRAPRLHKRTQGEVSVPVYILAFALSEGASVRVYSRNRLLFIIIFFGIFGHYSSNNTKYRYLNNVTIPKGIDTVS